MHGEMYLEPLSGKNYHLRHRKKRECCSRTLRKLSKNSKPAQSLAVTRKPSKSNYGDRNTISNCLSVTYGQRIPNTQRYVTRRCYLRYHKFLLDLEKY